MFGNRYFASNYFPDRFFPPGGDIQPVTVTQWGAWHDSPIPPREINGEPRGYLSGVTRKQLRDLAKRIEQAEAAEPIAPPPVTTPPTEQPVLTTAQRAAIIARLQAELRQAKQAQADEAERQRIAGVRAELQRLRREQARALRDDDEAFMLLLAA